ncbi:RagB/SusD family nutrient uptake outer membrane protein [Mucilaginibacter sp.]|uniref:RagB/SusD family nutrient uptake outer membrane protein n=1 Tax=Mucilaginibacter sp. TaxID=1882438 RepID=UPI0035BBCC40
MKKKYILILGMGVMLNYSCQKSKLSPVSQTSVTNDDRLLQFSTAARIQSQVLGLYANLRAGTFMGGRYQVYQEIKAENWINLSNNGVTNTATWNQSVTSTTTEVQTLWNQAYFTINNCNLLIDGLGKSTGVVTPAVSANYVGEAKFIRALAYYDLLQMYARPYFDGNGSKPGVPLRLKGNSVADNYDLARSTVAEVYAQIIKDLNDAETALPLTYGNDAATNTTRAHRNTAIALKTRVYLAMQQYSNVITEANKIVGTTTFTAAAGSAPAGGVANALQPDVTNVFKAPYTTTESIFSLPFSTTEIPGTQNQLGFYFFNNGVEANAEYYLNPEGVVADPNWKTVDKRRSLIKASTDKARLGFRFLLKYAQPSPYTDWAPIIRYAEVLLNLAEARARVNGVDAQAIALLNAIRGRSDASTVFTAAGFANGQALVNAILQERNIELLGEGFRNTDLVRLGLTIPAKAGGAPAVAPTSSNYIWPIPSGELLYNKLATPNP